MNELVFVTNNQHKLKEVREILGSEYQILSLSDIGCFEDIPETADILEGNALLKAMYVKEKYNYDCFADDTGLEVKALHNAPGVHSARYAGDSRDTSANVRKLLEEMSGIEDRKARFRTVIALIRNGKEYLYEGEILGTIIEELRGAGGFGYDPVFIPDGYSYTFAELGNEEKNKISHRAKAVRQLISGLNSLQEK